MEEDTQYDAMFADLLDDLSSSGRCELDSPPFGSLSPQSTSERSGDDDDRLLGRGSLSSDVCKRAMAKCQTLAHLLSKSI
jgi:hypothetical protein